MKGRRVRDYPALSIPAMAFLAISLILSSPKPAGADTERNSGMLASDPLLPICLPLPLPILGCPPHHPKPPQPPPTIPPTTTIPPPPPPPPPPPAPTVTPTQTTTSVVPQPRRSAPAVQPPTSTTTSTTSTTAPTTTTRRTPAPLINTEVQAPPVENKNVQTQRRFALTALILILGSGLALAAARRRVGRRRLR